MYRLLFGEKTDHNVPNSAFLSSSLFLFLLMLLYCDLTMFWGELFSEEKIMYMLSRYGAPSLFAFAFCPAEVTINFCDFGTIKEKTAAIGITAVFLLTTSYYPAEFFLNPAPVYATGSIDLATETDYFSEVSAKLNSISDPHSVHLLYFDKNDDVWPHRDTIRWILRDYSVSSYSNVDYNTICWIVLNNYPTHLYVRCSQSGCLGDDDYFFPDIEFNALYSVDLGDQAFILTPCG